MNPGEIITTEINTEIKVEVQLETASIVKVETTKGQCIKSPIGTENLNPTAAYAIEMHTRQAMEREKSRDEIRVEREAKKLAKQAKKIKAGGGAVSSDATVNAPTAIATNNKVEKINVAAPSKNADEDGTDKTREQIKAEREGKKLAKQAAKAAKTSESHAVAGGTSVVAETEQLNQVKINETRSTHVNSLAAATGDKVNKNLFR